MSRIRGPERGYRCVNDCIQEGCPGHTIRVDLYCTADVVEIYTDGKMSHCLDQNMLEALIESWDGLGIE